LCLYCV